MMVHYTKKRCLCADGKYRMAQQTAENDTFFSTPARVQVRGKTVSGFFTFDSIMEEWLFHANSFRKNHDVIERRNYGVSTY